MFRKPYGKSLKSMSKEFKPQDRVQYGRNFDKIGTLVSGLIEDKRYASGYKYEVRVGIAHYTGYDRDLVKLCNLIVIENSMFYLALDKYTKTLTFRWKK